MSERLKLPDSTPFKAEMLVSEAADLTPEAVAAFGEIVNDSGIGTLQIKAVKDLQPTDLSHLSEGHKRALQFGNSVVVDAGMGIGALIDAVPQGEQEFSTNAVNRALVEAGLVPEGRVMKMGTSGAVVDEQRGAEVTEITIFETRGKVTEVMSKSKAAWSDAEGNLQVSKLETDKRVLLENQFLVVEGKMDDSNALALQIDVGNSDVDLYQLIAKAAQQAGFEDYTVRCTIEGPMQATVSVIKQLPEQKIENMDGVKDVLVQYTVENNVTFHFVGSRSAQVSRQNERWGDISGNSVYSPNGHYHGYSVDGKVGGHIIGIKPQPGAKVMMIVEPAKVVQVVEKKIESLKEFNILQGRELTEEQADELYRLQQEFINGSLRDGFAVLSQLETGEKVESKFASHIKEIKGLIETNSADELLKYYEILHVDTSLNDRQKLFLEFLMGLGFVDLNIKIGLQTAQIMVDQDVHGEYFDTESKEQLTGLKIDEQGGGLLDRMRQPANVAYQIGNKMQELFGDDPEKYWQLVNQALKSNPELDALAKKLVSMRYVPEETEILGIAQSLHWSGWGGDGSALKEIPELNSPDFLRHVIAWHGGKAESEIPHFTKRMGLFAAMIAKIKESESKSLAKAVKANFSDEKELNIFDAGAGTVARGSANWIARSLQDSFGKITIDVGEVDGKSLKSLVGLKGKKPLPDLKDNILLGNAIRLDLNQPWDNAPTDKYHVFTLSIVLHQLMDSERGAKNVARVLKTATQATKQGGFIAWSDVGSQAYIQSTILPFNVADREGSVPQNIFEHISFDDVKVPTHREGEIQFYKIPYRLSKLRHSTPDSVTAQEGSGIYESNIFNIIEVPEWVVDQLNGVKENPATCDLIIAEYLEGSQDDVHETRQHFNALISEQLSL